MPGPPTSSDRGPDPAKHRSSRSDGRPSLFESEGKSLTFSARLPGNARSTLLNVSEGILLLALAALLAVDFAWPMRKALSTALHGTFSLLMLPWVWSVVHGDRAVGSTPHRLKVWLFRSVVLSLGLGFLVAKWWLVLGVGWAEPERFVGSSRSYAVALLMVLPLGLLGGGLRFSQLVTAVADHPARLMALTFGATGLLGGFLLSLPISMQRVSELSFVDNLFMSFSAVCVTGLAVNTLSETYTRFGQTVLCLLIQTGGLGIMVLSAAITVLAGQRLRVKSSAVLAEIVDTESIAGLRRLVLSIVGTTLIIELLGASVLYHRFASYPATAALDGGMVAGGQGAVWAAIFHAVSGFCNAGFSNFDSGLVPFTGDPGVLGTMIVLIVLGGIGFPVLHELMARLGGSVFQRRSPRLSLHTRISIRTTGLLLGLLGLAYVAIEWTASLSHLSWPERLLASLFHSASARTAGFNVIDVGAMRPASLMLTCIAMFIGACPGSCAGGIKTTTVAVLFAGLRSELQGRPARLLDRTVAPPTIRKAMGVAFLSIGIVSVGLFLLLLVEDHLPLQLAFEVFSAFSTTGLSTGITPKLTTAGKLLIILTMYIGRIGPLTLALALSSRTQPSPVQLPGERVLIG